MEKISKITKGTDGAYVVKIFSLEEGTECCMCCVGFDITGSTEEEFWENLYESKWVNLDSDEYNLTGYWCGECDYAE